MKPNLRIALGVGAALLGATALITRSAEKPKVSSNATNVAWIGNLVVGIEHAEVVGGPFPKADATVEIGLRGDGVLVWRKSQK